MLSRRQQPHPDSSDGFHDNVRSPPDILARHAACCSPCASACWSRRSTRPWSISRSSTSARISRPTSSRLQWVVDAYNLTYASLLLTGGVLADLYGRRRIFALGIVLFTVGSLICGFAPNVGDADRRPRDRGHRRGAGSADHARDPHRRLSRRERARASARHLGELQRPCLHHRPDARRPAGRSCRLAQHLPVDRSALPAGARVDVARVRNSSAPKGRKLDLPGQALGILALGSSRSRRDRGPALGLALGVGHRAALTFVVAARTVPARRGAHAPAR